MKTEVLSVPKFRSGGQYGDDVPLVLPGVVHGVFDGATDALGTVVDGMGAGRLAALAVAGSVAALMADPAARRLPVADILARISADLAAATGPLGLAIPPSTTMAVALDCGTDWRFITLGDTGIRLNGAQVLRHEKIIDDVSTSARVQVFRALQPSHPGVDATEKLARDTALLGLDHAVATSILTAQQAADIIAQTIADAHLHEAATQIEAFLRGGIKGQFHLANQPDHPLGFDTLNGTLPVLGQWVDQTHPKSAITSIEIFTDGYPDIPEGTSVADWEAAFFAAEDSDYHKTGRFASVKGSTADQFFDDRTVLILS